MKRSYTAIWSLLFSLSTVSHSDVAAQQMQEYTGNYVTFSRAAVQQSTITYDHPEQGLLYAGAPCADCYEILDKRTENTKTFADGRGRVWLQSSTDPMHYKNEPTQWLTIQPELAPLSERPGAYTSLSSPWPVTIDTRAGYTSIGRPGERIFINQGLELILTDARGEHSLGRADWSRHTAGDDGVYVTDAWPGIDMRITVFRGAAKTDFLIKKPLPGYASGNLTIRDHLQTDEGLYLVRPEADMISGPLEVRNTAGEKAYSISKALAWEHKGNNTSSLSYRIKEGGNAPLDLVIPGIWLNLPEAAYPVTIDPFVQSGNAVTVSGSDYISSCLIPTSGCSYLNRIPVPGGITITDVRFSFRFRLNVEPNTTTAGFTIHSDSCISPPTNLWTCFSAHAVLLLCGGNTNSIYESLKNCIPSPQCAPYDLDLTLRFKRCYAPSSQPCDASEVMGIDPFVVTIEGYTIGSDSSDIFATRTTICEGYTTRLWVTPGNTGVPPYRYLWQPGGATDSVITVSPTVSTEYRVSVTDQCGSVNRDTMTINVLASDNPGFTFSPDSVCPGTQVTIRANGNEPAYRYSWSAPGSGNPSLNNVKEWTTTYNAGGVYDITMYYQSDSCKFPYTKQITIAVPEPEIIPYGDGLSTSVAYTTYQWHRNGADIPGATNREYFPTEQTGIYTVTVTNEQGCTGTSEAYTHRMEIHSLTYAAAAISVYPNPVTDILYVHSPIPVHLTISSMDGKTLLRQEYAGKVRTDMLAPGVYLLRITDTDGMLLKTERLVCMR